MGHPDWPFGATDVRLTLKDHNGKIIERVSTQIHDDGANASEHNVVSVSWNNDTVVVQANMDEQIILDILKTDEIHYDEILEKSGMEPKALNTLLMRMELKGIIKKTANYYSK